MSGPIQLGISFGVVSLLARWVTGNTILSSPETLVKFGLAGGIGYALTGGIALILFGYLAKVIRRRYLIHQTIGDVLKEKLTPYGYWYTMSLLFFFGLYSLFIQAMGAGLLVHIMFPIPVVVGMLIFLGLCLLIGGIGGINRIHQLSGISVALIFGTVIILPVYFYIQKGVYPVFEGMKLYHPYILFIKNTEAISFISASLLVFFGQVLTDRATWQRIFIIQKEKVQMSFTLTGFIWTTIPIALTSLLIIIIYGRNYQNVYSLILDLVTTLQTTILIILFVLFCFVAILSASSSELHSLNTLFIKNVIGHFRSLTESEKWKFTYFFTGIVCGILVIVVSVLTPIPIQLLFFGGNLYAGIIIPLLYIILSNNTVPTLVPFSSLIGAFGGYLLLPITTNLQAIWISFFLSGIICFIVFISRFLFRKLNP
jgi:Na+/proline symporter